MVLGKVQGLQSESSEASYGNSAGCGTDFRLVLQFSVEFAGSMVFAFKTKPFQMERRGSFDTDHYLCL